jgi:hypothetical protein
MSLQVPLNLSLTNGHYTFTVPAHGYQGLVSIDLAGAGGGAGGNYYGSNTNSGGNGGRISGNFTVSPGDIIDVYVGDGGKVGSAGWVNGAGGVGGYGARIGDTYGSGTVYPVSLSWAWSGFMNTYAVWVNPDQVNPVGQLVTVTRIVNVPVGQSYQFEVQADNHIELYVDNGVVLTTDNFQASTYQNVYLNPGQHTITMNVENYGGPAGFAVTMTGNDTGIQYWNTRSNLNPNTYRYDFSGGDGGPTYGDGGYVYSGAGGGGGASVVFLNGNLILVAGGGGGGGAEGGHGAGGGRGGDAGSNGGGSPLATKGESGNAGYDIGGTPGGGGGYNGGSQGNYIGYDDAPSTGAKGGTNYNALNLTYTSGSGVYTVPSGVTQLTVKLLGGGGGGGGCGGNEEPLYTGGGGAGGDIVNVGTINVTPGQQIPWSVGSGGAGGAVGNSGLAGLPTIFGGYTAGGGYGGGIPYGANNGTYVGDQDDGWNQTGGAGGYPNGGYGGAYSEDAESGYSGAAGSNGNITIEIGSWNYSTYAGSGTLGNGAPGFCNFTFNKLGAGSVKVNNNWHLVTDSYIKVNNNWRQVNGAWVKVNGAWKLISASSTLSPSFIPA